MILTNKQHEILQKAIFKATEGISKSKRLSTRIALNFSWFKNIKFDSLVLAVCENIEERS